MPRLGVRRGGKLVACRTRAFYVRSLGMPFRPVTFGIREFVTIADLEAGHVVRWPCRSCRHVVSVAPYQLRARFPAWMKLSIVAGRWKCPRCGDQLPPRWHVELAESPYRVVTEADGLGRPPEGYGR